MVAPHEGQNLAAGGSSVPHDGHAETNGAPQDAQNLVSAGLSAPQAGQVRMGRV